MKRRLPKDTAFFYYVELGVERSYQLVADHFGVSKVSVTALARREGWQRRLAEMESKASQLREQQSLESMEERHQRHLSQARVLQAKGLEALKLMRIDNAMDGVRAVLLGMKQEAVLMGDTSDRTASVEALIKREYARWLVPGEEEIDAAPLPEPGSAA